MPSRQPAFDSRALLRFKRILPVACCLVCMTVGLLGAETNELSRALLIPKSVFVSEGDVGRDPFFPNSRRFVKKLPDEPNKGTPVKEDYSRFLKLNGITAGAKPIATINNLTFAVGEEQEVKVEGTKIRIRVLEIREKSVVVSVERQAAPIELKLRDGLLKFTE